MTVGILVPFDLTPIKKHNHPFLLPSSSRERGEAASMREDPA
jgi:hypothetical protein